MTNYKNIQNFYNNIDEFVLVARKLKYDCVTKKGTTINKSEYRRKKKILKSMLDIIEKEI